MSDEEDADNVVEDDSVGHPSSFNPNAPEFVPGAKLTAGVSFQSNVGGSLDVAADADIASGPSLVFGGSSRFLERYKHLQNPDPHDGTLRQRTRHDGNTTPQSSAQLGTASASSRVAKSSGSSSGPKLNAAASQVHVQLNSLLVHARTVDKILQVVDSHFDHFNEVNLITALHRLATVVLAPRRSALRRDVRFKRLTQKLSDTLRHSEVGLLKPQDLSNIAWALTKLGLLNAVLFGHLSDHILRTITAFQPVNLSMTLWAFARSGFLDEKLFAAAATEVKLQLREFQPQQIANTTWAMAKSGFVDEGLFHSAADLALEKLGEFQPMNYSMLLYSFALAKLPHPQLFKEVGRQCTAKSLSSAASAPHVVTNLALAFSDSGIVEQQVFHSIATAAAAWLHDFRTQQIATLAQAFARAEVRHERLFTSMTTEVVARLAEFKPQDLQDLLAAYDSLGLSTAIIAHAIEAATQQESGECNESEDGLTMQAVVIRVFLIAIALAVAGFAFYTRLEQHEGSNAGWRSSATTAAEAGEPFSIGMTN